jgi:hypothetical protein
MMTQKVYNPLNINKWLRGKGMSQFIDREYFGYIVSLHSSDWIRSWFRFPPLNLEFVPYWSGSEIYVTLKIKRTPSAKPSVLQYEWKLFKKGNTEPENNGKGVVDMTVNNTFKTRVLLNHFSFSDEYKIDLIINKDNESKLQTVGDIQITNRAEAMQSNLSLVISVIIGGIFGYILGRLS